MKKIILTTSIPFLFLNFIFLNSIYAQVGIGTTTPKTTLQVEGQPNNTTLPDGIQVPTLTITELEAKIIGGAYGANQDGAIVYISDATIGSSISETADIKNKGFYFYNHNGVTGTWRVITNHRVNMTNPDIVPRWDGTNLIEGSIIDSGGNIGIGTTSPDALLDVEGTFQFKNGTEGKSKLLSSDENGNATWQTLQAESIFGEGNLPEPDFSCLAVSSSLGIGPQPYSFALAGDYAYVIDRGSDDLKVIDISNPASPSLSGSLGIGAEPFSVAVAGDYAYVIDLASVDLKVIDISNPTSPSISGSLEDIGFAPLSVAVAGDYAYVADNASGYLIVIDISNPTSPSLSGSLDIGLAPFSIAVAGDYAYVVDSGFDDLKVIDISNPTSPSISGSLGIGTSPYSVAVAGDYAYVVDTGSEDLKIIDISNPASPSLSSSLDLGTGSFPTSLAVSGNYAYVVDINYDNLKVIDISNPVSPSLSGSLGIGPNPRSLAVADNYAYVTDVISDDLKVLNLSCSINTTFNLLSNQFESDALIPAVWKENANNIFNLNTGNVGIGTINPTSKLDVTGSISGSTLDTGQGANELYGMNQNVRTDDDVTFNTINTNNINTGPGTTEVHLMNQNVRTNDNVTFISIDTGHGDNELYAMNQNVRTSDAVSFNGGISWNSGANTINNVTGDYGSVQVNGSAASIYEGFSIDGRVVFVHDGSAIAGIWNDVNNEWIMRSVLNGATDLFYNGSQRLGTRIKSVYFDEAIEINGSINTTSVPGQTAMEKQIRIYHPSSASYWWSIGHQAATPTSGDDDLYFYVNKNGTQNVAGVILDQNPTTTMNFTGQHRTLVDGVNYHDPAYTQSLEGLIVVANKNEYLNMSGGLTEGQGAITIDEALPIVSLSSKAKDKSVFGVISTLESEERQDNAGAFATPYEKEKGDERFYVNSVGEGGIWVVDAGQPLESGDFIQTSDVTGYGMKQDDDLLHNYTVAKITMDCDFEP